MAVYNVPNYLMKDGFGMALNIRRGNPNPLDNSSVWKSFAEAQNYAQNDPTAYVGQILSVVNYTAAVTDDEGTVTTPSQSTVDVYYIKDEAGTLELVGISYVGDESTITVAEDGTVSLYGIDGLALTREDDEGNVTNITYQPLYVNGKLTWVEPSATTVEGLAAEIEGLKTRISALETAVGNDEAGLVKDVADLKTTVGDDESGLVKGLADVSAKADANETAIGTLQTDLDTAEGKISDLETVVGDEESGLVKGLADVTEKAGANETAIGTLQSDLDTAEGKISTLETTVGDSESGLVKDVADVTAKASANETAIGTLQSDLDTAEGEIDTLKTTVGDAESGLVKGLADVSAKADANEGNISNLTERMTTAEGDISGIKTTLADVYSKSETAEKIAEEIGKQAHFSAKVVSGTSEMTDSTVLYLVKQNGATGSDVYDEYIVIDGTPTLIGETSTDLSDYATLEALDVVAAVANAAAVKSEVEAKFAEVEADVATKAAQTELDEVKATANAAAVKATVDAKFEEVEGAIATKAAQTDLDNVKATANAAAVKATVDAKFEEVEGAIATKASQTELDEVKATADAAAVKETVDAKFAEVDAAVATKAEASALDNYVTNDTHAADMEAVNTELGTKALASDLAALTTTVGNNKTAADEALAALQLADSGHDSRIKALEDVGSEKNVIAAVSSEFAVTEDTRTLSITTIDQSKVTGLAEALAGKVSVKEGYTLLSPDDQAKLNALVLGEGNNVEISGKVNASNVEELDTWVSTNRDSLGGLFSSDAEEKLNGIEAGAQVNVIETIQVAGTAVSVTDKTVNIPFATADLAGVIKSAVDTAEGKTVENAVYVDATTGVGKVKAVNVNSLVQSETDTLILNGGNAATGTAN